MAHVVQPNVKKVIHYPVACVSRIKNKNNRPLGGIFFGITFGSAPMGRGTRGVVGVFWITHNDERLESNPLPSSTALPHAGGEPSFWNRCTLEHQCHSGEARRADVGIHNIIYFPEPGLLYGLPR